MKSSEEKIIDDIQRLSHQLSSHPHAHLYGPAAIWESHCQKHVELIRRYGLSTFKRTINFEYGQWGVRSLRDPKIRNLFLQFLREGRWPKGFLSTRVQFKTASPIRWSDLLDPATGHITGEASKGPWHMRAYLLVYALYVHMLWQYALLHDKINCLADREEPDLGEPIPVMYKRKRISQDLAMSSLELNRIATYIHFQPGMKIAEIGAGYGRLAHLTVEHFPRVGYFIFDIPPALAIAQFYLSELLGKERVRSRFGDTPGVSDAPGVTLSLSHELENAPNATFDLLINISSFDEMSPEQVRHYFSLIEQKGKGLLYVKGYTHSRSSGNRLGVLEFPYRPHWKLLFEGQDPVVPLFTERIYQLR